MGFKKKNGLIYSEDMATLLGVDTSTNEFTGRIPFGVHNIDDELFTDAPFESISMPDSVKKVGRMLFMGSAALKKVKCPSALDELSDYMFADCVNLSSLTMPNEVPFFPEGCFKNCRSLAEVPFRTDCVSVGKSAFEGCTGFKSVVVPDSVEKIGPRAFAGCTGIESLVIGAHCYEIAPDAFAGCTNLAHIRVVEDNQFFVCDEDGNLLTKDEGSDRKVVISPSEIEQTAVSFFEQPDKIDLSQSNSSNTGLWIEAGDDEEETDDMFSAEIGAGEEEMEAMGADASTIQSNDMLADILNQNSTGPSDIGVSESESEILAQTMNVMSEKADEESSNNGSVSADELANLFAASEPDNQNDEVSKNLEKNLRILCDSVPFSLVEEVTSCGKASANSDLYVVAEKLITDSNGKETVSAKLKACCEKLAAIHDLKRIIYLSGLDMDNDEFVMFFHNVVAVQNVLVACDASSPSTLSPYCKAVCDHADISLEKDEINSQRKKAGIKNPSLLKLVVQDKYDA